MSITSVVNDTVTSESVINALKPLPPTISGYSVGGLDDTALDPAGGQTVQINGTGFLAGATITFDGSAVAVVTYVSPNRLTFTSPAKTAGTYTIYAVNPDGGTAIFIPGIIYSVLPTWTTSAGTLGSYYETTSISNTVVASGDAPITYSLYSGSLPTGSTLYANGVITGTAPVDSSSTTYSFTIEAIDAQLQGSTRSFSLTINVDAVTWVSPANATTYTSAVDSAIANVTLSATDAAGYAVSYSANALPTGLSLTGSNIAGTPTVIADSSTLLTATAATTNRTAVRTINWSITVANDPYFEYNTLLIPGASTTFVDDASTNNFAVTINGDTKPNNFNPYTPGYYSNYFDGSSYLSVANNANLNLSNSSFTIELWVYGTGSNAQGIISKGNTSSLGSEVWSLEYTYGTSNGQIGFGTGAYNSWSAPIVTGTVTLNAWNHVAVVRNGNVHTMYINGVSSSSSTASYTVTNAGTLYIGTGSYAPSSRIFSAGYISNVRLVIGTAVYTGNFTPSTTPLTAIANTVLLISQSNRFIDNSTNNFTITVNGNTSISSFDPFVPNSSYSTYGSGYFDGTGDWLSVASSIPFDFGSGNFTLECWAWFNNFSSDYRLIAKVANISSYGSWQIIVDTSGYPLIYASSAASSWDVCNGVGGGIAIKANCWNHIAATRSGNTFTMWVNGVSSGTTTNASSLYYSASVPVTVGGMPDGTRILPGYITDARIVKGTAVYTTTFTPPSAPLTAIANTSLLTLQNNQSVNNNVFLDNSTNNFFVTRNGNTTQGTFSPYGGNWSNYFTGSSYLNLPSSSALSLGTGDFCIEGWLNVSSASTVNTFIQTNWAGAGAGSSFAIWHNVSGYANKIYVASWSYNSAAPLMISTTQLTFGQWYHIAVTRSGTSWKLFINGVSEATASGSYNIGSQLLYIGCYDTTNFFFQGYISNTRVVKGSAVYTSNFTPSTTPLTAIANTSLLTCQSNRFIDNSTNALALTISGTPTVQRYSPFNPSSVTPTSYSGYFDGTGDYLTAPNNAALAFGSGDFTMECWVYFQNSVSNNGVFQLSTSLWPATPSGLAIYVSGGLGWGAYYGGTFINAGTAPTVNTWYHVALVRSGASTKLYVNGASVFSAADTTNYTGTYLSIGGYYSTSYLMAGYISNFRVVKGTAVYTSNFTPPTSPLTAISGTSLLTLQSPTFIDNSTNNFAITAYGNSQPSIQNPFGYTSATTNGYTVSTIGGSGYFDGTGDYLLTPSSNNLVIGTGNFAVEAWIYPTVYDNFNGYVSTVTNASDPTGFSLSYDQGWIGSTSITATYAWASLLTLNAWNHIAITREGTTVRWFVNGILRNTATSSLNLTSSTAIIGARYYNGTYLAKGYISDARIVSGSAVYTSSFVPPSAPLTAVQNTALLTNMTSAGVYDAAMMNNMETVADAKLSTAVSKFGGSSMSFDGTGDCLYSPATPNLTFGTGDFTIEMWVNPTSLSSTLTFFFGMRPATTNGFYPVIYADNTGTYWYVNSVNRISGGVLSTNTWTHMAVCRSGSSTKMFFNGTQTGGTFTDTSNYLMSRLYIGASDYNSGTSEYLTGYIDDLRVTKGYARYTSNFTAPTIAFPIY